MYACAQAWLICQWCSILWKCGLPHSPASVQLSYSLQKSITWSFSYLLNAVEWLPIKSNSPTSKGSGGRQVHLLGRQSMNINITYPWSLWVNDKHEESHSLISKLDSVQNTILFRNSTWEVIENEVLGGTKVRREVKRTNLTLYTCRYFGY